MSQAIRPMLAVSTPPEDVRLPIYAQPKFDGIRMLVVEGEPQSRSGKILANRNLRRWVAQYARFLEGLDGELVVGDPTAKDVYRRTASVINSHEAVIDEVAYIVFDSVRYGEEPYRQRMAFYTELLVESLPQPLGGVKIQKCHTVYVDTLDELVALEERFLKAGYEGLIARDPNAPYKKGRSTPRSQELVKIKRHIDAEAVVVDVEELMHNDNPLEESSLGYAQRTSHKRGLRHGGVLGALVVEAEVNGKVQRFRIGTGFDHSERHWFWQNPPIGKIAKFKYVATGMKDLPRHPVFLGFRAQEDLGGEGV